MTRVCMSLRFLTRGWVSIMCPFLEYLYVMLVAPLNDNVIDNFVWSYV